MLRVDQLWVLGTYLCYLVLWCVCRHTTQLLLWITGATERNRQQNRTVQVFKIAIRRKILEIIPPDKHDFLGLFQSFETLDYLARHSIILYAMDQNHAYFVDTLIGMDIYNMENSHPQTSVRLYKFATQYVVVPVEEFREFADALGDPKERVFLVSSTGRCGSTVLCRMLDATNKCLVICENNSLGAPCYPVITPSLQTPEMLVALFRVMCKPTGGRYEVIIIRPMYLATILTELVKKHVHFVHHIIMYRNGLDTVVSKLVTHAGILYESFIGSDNARREKLLKNLLRTDIDILVKVPIDLKLVTSPFECMCWKWASIMTHLLKARQDARRNIPILRYDDLVRDPRTVFRNLLLHLGLPGAELVERGVVMMGRDSQDNSWLSRDNMKRRAARFGFRFDRNVYQGQVKVNCDQICDSMDVPRLSDSTSLDETFNKFK